MADEEIETGVDEEVIESVYDCEDNPLQYMLEPRGSVDIVSSKTNIKKQDFEKQL